MEVEIQPTPPIHLHTFLSNGRCTLIEIQDLQASDLLPMDLTGLSDPYIKFYSVPSNAIKTELSGSHPSTATISNTLSPTWKNNQIPKLYLLCDNEKEVKKIHIIFLIMDYDTTSKDDVMGMFTVSLDSFVSSLRPRFFPFESEIVRHGKPAGKISGKICVTLPSQAQNTGGYLDGGSVRNMARCHCCVS
jgi:Ca2+-dependent lipid-binding protein